MSHHNRQWCALDEIIQAALADVIRADAQFQLKQAEAWQQFSDSVKELSNNPMLQSIDLSVGFGRLENLALNELDISLGLDVDNPSLTKRMWWGFIKFFGFKPEKKPTQYRLSQHPPGWKNRVEFKLKLTRNETGKWETSHNLPMSADKKEVPNSESTEQ